MHSRWRLLIFLLVLAVSIWWVSATGGSHASMVRHFLRNLLRTLF